MMANLALLLLLVLTTVGLYVFFQAFIQLMLFSDKDFPGRHDKVLWFVFLCLTNIIGALFFLSWKKAYLAMRQAERGKLEP